MKIAWSVKLPKGAKLKIKNGQRINCGDLIYENQQNIVERLPLIGWAGLGSDDRKKILQQIIKKDLEVGQTLGTIGWLSKKLIKSPGKGKCLGVDEFGNIELETEIDEKYVAPVFAEKIRVDDDKLIFELKGFEFEAEGVNNLKAWGDLDNEIVNETQQVNSESYGKILVVEGNLEAATKAEAVGVAGLILVDFDKKKEFEDADIPVVSMEKDEYKKMDKAIANKQSRVWLNASAGKVMVVLE